MTSETAVLVRCPFFEQFQPKHLDKLMTLCTPVQTSAAGQAIHPVFGLPRGLSKPLPRHDAEPFRSVAGETLEFAKFTYGVFEKVVHGNSSTWT